MDIAAEEVQVWIEYYSVAFVECHQLSVVKEIQVLCLCGKLATLRVERAYRILFFVILYFHLSSNYTCPVSAAAFAFVCDC